MLDAYFHMPVWIRWTAFERQQRRCGGSQTWTVETWKHIAIAAGEGDCFPSSAKNSFQTNSSKVSKICHSDFFHEKRRWFRWLGICPGRMWGFQNSSFYRQPYVCAARRSPMHSKCHRRATEESGGMDSKAVPGFKMEGHVLEWT